MPTLGAHLRCVVQSGLREAAQQAAQKAADEKSYCLKVEVAVGALGISRVVGMSDGDV